MRRAWHTTEAETGMTAPLAQPVAKATAVMVWAPGVDGAVNVKVNNETPTLAKLVKRFAAACGRASAPDLVSSCANDVGAEPLTGTRGVVPITEPSTWQPNVSPLSAASGSKVQRT